MASLQAELAQMQTSLAEQAELVHQSRVVAEAREAEATSSVAALHNAQAELAALQQQFQSQPSVAVAVQEPPALERGEGKDNDQNSEALAMARVVAETHQAKAAALAQEVAKLRAQVHSLKESAAAVNSSSNGNGEIGSEAAAEATQKKTVALEAGNKKLIERVSTLVSGHIEITLRLT